MTSRKGLLLANSLELVIDWVRRGCERRRMRSVFSFSSSVKRLELWASRWALCLAFVSLTLRREEVSGGSACSNLQKALRLRTCNRHRRRRRSGGMPWLFAGQRIDGF